MSTNFSSRNPVTGDTLWQGTSSDCEEVSGVVDAAHAAATQWRRVPVEERIDVVRAYGEQLAQRREEITDLLVDEIGKLPWDATGEVAAAIAKIDLSITALKQRRNDERVQAGEPQRWVRFHPLGVIVVLGPFNFPLHLPGGQIIPALLAGNAVVFKPSEQATAVGDWMMQAWQRAGVPNGVLQSIYGGAETARLAIDSPQITGVFLTGSRDAGRAIHQQLAGRYDVLLALELGGNNPMVIMPDVSPQTAATLATYSAFLSAGQRCTCARRVIVVDGPQRDDQINAIVDRTKRLRVGLPRDRPAPEVGPLISDRAASQIRATYQQLLDLGCRSVVPMEIDRRASCLVNPGIVDASSLDAEAMERIGALEWFGPLMVLMQADSYEQAMQMARATPYGLAASLLGGTEDTFQRFVAEVGAGVVNWNGPTTGAAGVLPFGGLGDSGNHRPAGFYAIDACNDPVASLQYSEPLTKDLWDVAR